MDFHSLVAALRDPQIYPDKPVRVDLVQTHISVIFLAGEQVYKVKKPVNLGFLDFSTLQKRRFYCQQEVDLNRRLAPDIYLGVVEIRLHDGRVFLGDGPGEIVEYAVHMKRLPLDCQMDRLLAAGALPPGAVDRIAARIAQFHNLADTSPEISSFGELQAIRENVEENFAQTVKFVGKALDPTSYRETIEATRLFTERQSLLFEKRIRAGKIRDCHGDLHLQHICLGREIIIFDCIEFNRRFRYSDVAADLAFLLMDLDEHGHPLLSADLASAYLRFTRDWPLFLLLDFYKSYRAYVRAKVASFRSEDPDLSPGEQHSALEEARRYYSLAHFYARRMNRPFLVITGGLIGTGKSTVARSLAEALGWEWLRADQLRKELARVPAGEHRFEEFQRGIYSPDFSRRTYQALLQRAGILLGEGKTALLDGSFKKQADRNAARELAREKDADFLLIECQCADGEIQKRLARRAQEKNEPSDGRWEILGEQKKDYDPVEGFGADLHLLLDTGRAPEECLGIILQHLLQRSGRDLSAVWPGYSPVPRGPQGPGK